MSDDGFTLKVFSDLPSPLADLKRPAGSTTSGDFTGVAGGTADKSTTQEAPQERSEIGASFFMMPSSMPESSTSSSDTRVTLVETVPNIVGTVPLPPTLPMFGMALLALAYFGHAVRGRVMAKAS